ncbi:ornithine cyclodeaminase [Methanolinea mesophila]|uniref:ornithine cyclodeaminase family protein n=1 Tax=Methanolinea mesophila TaxID=547055 RepID=UPI001AE734A2|nr:ornithine cyclodeaminase family protein [Methanolinea mesophila]MBP1928835.1 ornithine cyclodeaminase [Methanolinea mesophila]
MRILTAGEVRKALPMDLAISAMEDAFSAFSSGKSVCPPRTRMKVPEESTDLLFMPASYRSGTVSPVAVKTLGVNPGNAGRGIPTVHASVLLADGATGAPLALLEGGALTAIRTGAASGLATRLLSRPGSRVLAIFGTGTQARAQALGVCAVRRIEELRVFSPHRAHVAAFIRECAGRDSLPERIVPASSPGDALKGADIVCTATTSSTPVFSDDCLNTGAHINAVGSYLPGNAEIPPETVARARVYVDSREAAFSEAGDLILPLARGVIGELHVQGELGELLQGRVPGRQSPEAITLFKSVGIAVQDVAAAWECYRNALRLGIGQDIGW